MLIFVTNRWLRHCFALYDRADACWCSYYREENERRESVSERYGIRVAYRTLHQHNTLSDTRQRYYGAMKYTRVCM